MSSSSPDNQTMLVDGLVELCFAVHGMLVKIGARHDLSITQVRLLGILRDHEPTVQQLAAHLGLEKSSVSGLVDRAEARRLVHRNASKTDGRVVHIAITKVGRALAERVEREITLAVVGLTQRLSTTDRQRLTTLLHRLIPSVDQQAH